MKDAWWCPCGGRLSGCSHTSSCSHHSIAGRKSAPQFESLGRGPIMGRWGGACLGARKLQPVVPPRGVGTRGSSPAAPSASLPRTGDSLPPPSPFLAVAQPRTYHLDKLLSRFAVFCHLLLPCQRHLIELLVCLVLVLPRARGPMTGHPV